MSAGAVPDQKEEDALTYAAFMEPEKQRKWHGNVADLWNIRPKDYIFFYVTNQGFKGVYETASKPFFDDTRIGDVPRSRPLRILIQPIKLFDIAVPEEIVFSNSLYQRIFWVWYFNKMRGRGRGCNPIDPDARNKLIELLVRRNYGASPPSSRKPYPNDSPEKQELRSLFLRQGTSVNATTENSLRAAILKAIGDGDTRIKPVVGDLQSIEWYANNVPYHVAGKNIDLLLYHKAEQFSPKLNIAPRVQYSVVELKRDKAKLEDLHQLINYCEWAGAQLAEGELYMVKPVLVARGFSSELLEFIPKYRLGFKPVALVSYEFGDDGLTFVQEHYP